MGVTKVLFTDGLKNITKPYGKTVKAQKVILGEKDKERLNQQKEKSWGSKLAPVFKMMTFVSRYRLYRPYRWIPYETLYGWGHLLGAKMLGMSGKVRKQVRDSIKAFYPNISKKNLQKYTMASLKYQGGLLLDYMFNLGLTTETSIPYDHFFEWVNPEILNNALKEGKGAIVAVTHIGSFLMTMPAFSEIHLSKKNPNQWKIASVANLHNSSFYQFLINKPDFDRLYVYPSISFNKIGKYLEKHLHDNFVLIMFSDYSTPKNMRVPLMPNYPHLVHTVQSNVALHRKTGAPIIPCIATPRGGLLGRHRLEFLDNTAIMETSKKYWNASEKEFYGQVSMQINFALYPHIRKWCHVWEEIQNFAWVRLGDKLKLPGKISLKTFLEEIGKKMKLIIDMSYEPERKDTEIIQTINSVVPNAIGALEHPESIFRDHKTRIMLSSQNAHRELDTLCKITIQELQAKNEQKSASLIQDLRQKLNELVE